MRILIAANNENLLKVISLKPDTEVVDVVENKDNLRDYVMKYAGNIDTLFATEGLNGVSSKPLTTILCEIKMSFPALRIIYLTACDIDENDDAIMSSLSNLVKNGIFDIYTKKKVSRQIIYDLIDNVKNINDVYNFANYHKTLTPLPKEPQYSQTIIEGTVGKGKNNVIVVSSIKPGTGKSFISTNIAADIARFGKPKANGMRPNIVIVEGDLQTLSVGTLLGIENNTYNLKEALKEAAKVVNEDGNIIGSYEQQENFKHFVRKCCLPYRNQENLHALVGSQLNFTEIGNINPYQYFYMIEIISEMFDVVIIDANSSLEHRTTGPILQLASKCFYVLDLDFNNVRSNLRYRQELSNLGVIDKVQYILNKAVTQEAQSRFAEKLDYDEEKLKGNGFRVIGRVPMIDNAVVLNRMYDQIPIVYDETYVTLTARMEFCQLAGKIWPMTNILNLKLELDELKKGKNKNKKRKK